MCGLDYIVYKYSKTYSCTSAYWKYSLLLLAHVHVHVVHIRLYNQPRKSYIYIYSELEWRWNNFSDVSLWPGGSFTIQWLESHLTFNCMCTNLNLYFSAQFFFVFGFVFVFFLHFWKTKVSNSYNLLSATKMHEHMCKISNGKNYGQ